MNENDDARWAALEAHAQRLLEHAKEVEPRDAIRRFGSLLRLWHFPAFAAQQTWTILTPGRKAPDGASPVVREITWDSSADQQRMLAGGGGVGLGFAPSIRLREAGLPAPLLHRLLADGAALAVPLLGSANVVGLDGEYFGLETYAVSPNVRVQWWCAGPVEWRHFTDWVGALRAFLLRCLDETG